MTNVSRGRCRIPSSRRDYWVAKIQRNATRDKRTRRQLHRLGWQVLVIWKCQIKPSREDWLRRRIIAFLNKNEKPAGRKKRPK
ncbi:MAG: hypothetical protein ABFD90_13080 [Phycisphaerales bacterium]